MNDPARNIRSQVTDEEKRQALSEAVLNVIDYLDISHPEEVLGISASSYRRIKTGDRLIDVKSDEGNRALYLVRIFKGLSAVSGGSRDEARHFMKSKNAHLAGQPSEMIRTIEGLIDVSGYLDRLQRR